MFWGVGGERSVVFIKFVYGSTIWRATAIKVVGDQVMKGFEYQAKEFLNCTLKILGNNTNMLRVSFLESS